MTQDPAIRPAGAGDAATMAGLHAAGFESAWPETDFAGWLDRDAAFAVIAGSDAGFALALESGDDAEVLTIAVAPALRGRGLGLRLLTALDAEAARRGLARWVLEVSRNNLPARALYSRAGFMEIAVRKDYYSAAGVRVDAIVLARTVGWPGGQAGA